MYQRGETEAQIGYVVCLTGSEDTLNPKLSQLDQPLVPAPVQPPLLFPAALH